MKKAFLAAFPFTLPIFAGFWFIGLAYGMYAHVSGFSFWYPVLMAIVIFGGSLEFVTIAMLLSPFAPLQTFIVAFVIQARHLFYGIAMLDKYKNLGWKKIYLIYGMCDETFAINFTTAVPKTVDKGWFMFFITFLNQLYWVSGVAMGATLGSFLDFNMAGLDFVMPAMFTAIFMEQFLQEKQHYTAWIGLVAAILCLLVFGTQSFMIPTLLLILAAVTVFRKPIAKAGEFL
ncbi:MAG: AzlC family ABC transporter permease [Megasphaera sp.]|jgi:4-azaleucine resistance transporter AzlC|nr:AzlC family ABC transporter permease [Megasphaera sp.]MCH4187540.1 AzlC family ABC transporter permease [Megasphaera sp.]MCH4217736.1 AzlC family ABC transporter permease [Megasphaera sp.]